MKLPFVAEVLRALNFSSDYPDESNPNAFTGYTSLLTATLLVHTYWDGDRQSPRTVVRRSFLRRKRPSGRKDTTD
jgi:hypothetical protein